MQSIEIKGPFISLNEYIKIERSNWRYAAKVKKDETNAVRLQVLNKKIETPCFIEFIWFVKNRKKDPDNIAFSKKFILDGMVSAGVIPDDSYKNILGFVDRFVIGSEEKVVLKTTKKPKEKTS